MDINSILECGIDYLYNHPDDKEQLWKKFLELLKQDQGITQDNIDSTSIGSSPLRELDSLIDWTLNQNSISGEDKFFEGGLYKELKQEMIKSFKDSLKTIDSSSIKSNSPYWNESVQKLISSFLLHLDPEVIAAYENSGVLVEKEDGTIDTDYLRGSIETSNGVKLRIKDVQNADAGNSFVSEREMYSTTIDNKKELKTVVNPWVVSWYNIDGVTYKKVRSNDRINGVLKNDKHLDFTREKTADDSNHQIRLIMPRNKHRVEVEDLDRNFWVISQALAAICVYLFDDKSPINNTIKGLLKEIGQLWENILYLWTFLAIQNQKKYYDKVHIEVLPITNITNSLYSYHKYDNVYKSDYDLESIKNNNIEYLKNLYSEYNLIILPVVRDKNYEEGHYYSEQWVGAILYDRNRDVTELINFQNVSFNMKDLKEQLKERIGCFRENESTGTYLYYSSLEMATSESQLHSYENYKLYYGISISLDNATYLYNENGFDLEQLSFSFKIADISDRVINEQTNYGSFNLTPTNNYALDNTIFKNKPFIIREKKSEESKILSGVYLNEVCSYFVKTPEIIYTLDSKTYNRYPRNNIDEVNNIVYAARTEDEIKTKYTKEDENFLLNSVTSDSIAKNSFTLMSVSHMGVFIPDPWYRDDYPIDSLTYYDKTVDDIKVLNGEETWYYEQKDDSHRLSLYSWAGSGEVFTTAIVICPYLKFEKIYSKFPHSLHMGQFIDNNTDKNDITHYNDYGFYYSYDATQTYFYIKQGDTKIKENNWCIEYIQATGTILNNDGSYLNNYKDKYVKTENTVYAITEIYVSLFYSDGSFKQRKYTREKNTDDFYVLNGKFNYENKCDWSNENYNIEDDLNWITPKGAENPKENMNFNLYHYTGYNK